jgi:hypothetical protein
MLVHDFGAGTDSILGVREDPETPDQLTAQTSGQMIHPVDGPVILCLVGPEARSNPS